MKNIFSIDLESWIHFYEDSLKIKKFTSAERKKSDAGYIVNVTRSLLQLLEQFKQNATFFVVSEIYDWYPSLIREIQQKGHEIGHHTHTHQFLKNAEILKEELSLSKSFIKDFKPRGFRAPQIYLPQSGMKYLEQYGFTYSSSSYDEYVITHYGSLVEIPVSVMPFKKQSFSRSLPKPLTVKLLLSKIPFGSGMSIAVFGSKTSWFIEKLNREGKPAILFIHPWQIYQPSDLKSINYKINLILRNPLCFPYTRNIEETVRKLFKAHQFTSFREHLHGQQAILGQ